MRVRMLAVGLLAVGVMLSQAVPSLVPAELHAQQVTMKVCTLKMTGMTCAGCTTAVKLAAKKVDGVKDATASYEKSTAEITYDPAKTNPDAIAKVVTEQSGFKAEVLKKQKS
jgi:periplasmic mercuric ion binding protein